jgi:RimJ/RimL family protein N-acetyltransferase
MTWKPSSNIEWVTVKTTLPVYPFPPNDQRRAVMTDRLILRPFKDDDFDLQGLHAIRARQEVMHWSIQGRPDKDVEETRHGNFALQIAPKDTQRFNLAITLASTGQIIGIGGSGSFKGEQGWPEVGYMLHPDAWGKGYATEFLDAFLETWWALPRAEAEVTVDKRTVRGDGEVKDEVISATADSPNFASHNVLRKAGFEKSGVWVEDDLRDLSKKIELHGFMARKGVKASA